MKCLRLVGQGIPIRVPDAEAKQIVEKDFDGEYCSKSFYKNYRDSPAGHAWRRLAESGDARS